MNLKAKPTNKLIALVMALILLMSVFSGCKLPDNTITNDPVTIESESTDASAVEATPTPEPTFTVDQAATMPIMRWTSMYSAGTQRPMAIHSICSSITLPITALTTAAFR